jgi:hypothetical protein
MYLVLFLSQSLFLPFTLPMKKVICRAIVSLFSSSWLPSISYCFILSLCFSHSLYHWKWPFKSGMSKCPSWPLSGLWPIFCGLPMHGRRVTFLLLIIYRLMSMKLMDQLQELAKEMHFSLHASMIMIFHIHYPTTALINIHCVVKCWRWLLWRMLTPFKEEGFRWDLLRSS